MPNDLETRWRIGFMPYLNSAVFYSRLEGDWFDLVELPPRNMAAAMQNGELDAGPLPIAESSDERPNRRRRVRRRAAVTRVAYCIQRWAGGRIVG